MTTHDSGMYKFPDGGKLCLMSKGFTLIEAAIVLLVAGIVLTGFMGILQSMMTTRQNQIQNEAVETVKTTVTLDAVKNKSVSTGCVSGSCNVVFGVLMGCGVLTEPCPVYINSYPIPATITSVPDFWGNSFTYVRNATSVSSTTAATTPVYTLLSKGPDATAGTTDDISYTVTAAEFIARVSRMGL